MEMVSAACRGMHWLGLVMLVTACSNTPALPSGSPMTTGPAPSATISAYPGHTSTVFAVAWSPDGTRIVSGGNDNTIQVWNATTGKRLLTYTGHLGSIWAVAWSPDGRRMASGGNDGTVQVWETSSGHRLLTYTGHTAPVRGVAWSPDGTRIASASQDGTMQVWDATSGKPLFSSGSSPTPEWVVAWSPSGHCLAEASGNTSEEQRRETVQVWSATSEQLLISYPVPSSAFLAYADGTLSLTWSPGGTCLASGGADTIVHLWNAPALCQE